MSSEADLATVFIMITVEHLPGIQNVQAGLESRQKGNTSNWMLNKRIFKQINKMKGTLKINILQTGRTNN